MSLVKKGFRSKTAVTECGYCNIKIKEENLEKHCKAVHKKPKLVARQRTLEGLMNKPPSTASDSNKNEAVDLDTPDPELESSPPAKKLRVSSDDEMSEDDKNESSSKDIEDFEMGAAANAPIISTGFTEVPNCKLDEIVGKIDAIKAAVDTLNKKSIPDIAKPPDVAPSDDRVSKLVLCKSIKDKTWSSVSNSSFK